MVQKLRLILIEDHTILRETLVVALNMEEDLEVAGHWGSAEEALSHVAAIDFDVAIIDHMLPGMDGIEFLRKIREMKPQVRTVILSMNKLEDIIIEAFNAGANGYLSKDISTSDLIASLRKVAAGEVVLSKNLAARVTQFRNNMTEIEEPLKEEEILMLRYASEGRTNREIAGRLGLSYSGIKMKFQVLFHKLEVHDRTSAVAKALRKGLITVSGTMGAALIDNGT